MIAYYNRDDYVPEWEYELCPFHKERPNDHYAGCTCTAWYSLRRKSEEEKKKERDKRSIRDRSKTSRPEEE